MKKKSKTFWKWIAGFILLTSLFIWMKKIPSEKNISCLPVVRRDLDVKVTCVGELNAVSSTLISSELPGDRGKIVYLVEDGTDVRKGDVLVRLDPAFFSEKVNEYSSRLKEKEAVKAARYQLLEWEKNQAEQQILASKYNVKVAYLEWKRLVEGEGPLELEKLKSAMRKAKQEYEEKSGYVDDIAKLDKQGLVNAVEINQTKNNVEESRQLYLSSRLQLESYQKHVLPTLIEKARAGLRKNRIELEQTRKSSGFKIGEAAANLKQAEEDLRNVQIQLEQARQELEKTEIKSPVSGLVVLYEDYRGGSKRPPRIGDTVWQNQPILFLPDLSAMKVKTRVHESELHLIAKGEKAIICVDAYPDLLLEGEVDSIGILAEHNPHWSAGDKYFQVMLHLVKTDSRLRPGMTTQAQIVAASAKNILTVPVQTIYSANGNKYCHVKDGRHWVRREILTGLQNEDFVEIVSGLKEGDSVSALPLEEL